LGKGDKEGTCPEGEKSWGGNQKGKKEGVLKGGGGEMFKKRGAKSANTKKKEEGLKGTGRKRG